MKKQYKERLLTSVPEEYDTEIEKINIMQMFPCDDKTEIDILWRTHGNYSKVVDIILKKIQIKQDYEYSIRLNKNNV